VVEDYIGNLADGTGTASVYSTGDTEVLIFSIAGQYWNLPAKYFGSGNIRIKVDKYRYGSGTKTVKYRTGATKEVCEAASWTAYTVPFSSLGWAQVRIES